MDKHVVGIKKPKKGLETLKNEHAWSVEGVFKG